MSCRSSSADLLRMVENGRTAQTRGNKCTDFADVPRRFLFLSTEKFTIRLAG